MTTNSTDSTPDILEITTSVYMPSLGYLACGRHDGSIVIVPAVEAITLQLLENGRLKGRNY